MLYILIFINKFYELEKKLLFPIFLILVLILFSSAVVFFKYLIVGGRIDLLAFFLQGLMIMWMIASFYLWVVFISRNINMHFLNDRLASFNAIFFSSIIVVLFFLIEYFHPVCSFNHDVYGFFRLKSECTRASGLMSEPSLYGAWGNFITPLLIYFLLFKKTKKIHIFFIALLMLTFVLSGARTFIVIFLLQIFIFFFPNRWVLLLISCCSVFLYPIAFVLFKGVDLSVLARLSASYTSLLAFLDSPLLGYGIGQFGEYFQKYVPSEALLSTEVQSWYLGLVDSRVSTFSVPLRMFFELGFLGIILFVVFVFYPAKLIDSSKLTILQKRLMYCLLLGGNGFLYSQDQYGYQLAIFSSAIAVVFTKISHLEIMTSSSLKSK